VKYGKELVSSDWPYVAGYFDGDGTVEVSVQHYTLHIRLAFDENWRPHLDAVKHFLETRGIRVGLVRKKESFNTWHVVVSNNAGVIEMARNLVRHCTKKREELVAVLNYYSDAITGDEFISQMNSFVMIGERTGKIRGGGPPFTRTEGRELAFLAGRITKTMTSIGPRIQERNISDIGVTEVCSTEVNPSP
jgi:hypothetical protein